MKHPAKFACALVLVAAACAKAESTASRGTKSAAAGAGTTVAAGAATTAAPALTTTPAGATTLPASLAPCDDARADIEDLQLALQTAATDDACAADADCAAGPAVDFGGCGGAQRAFSTKAAVDARAAAFADAVAALAAACPAATHQTDCVAPATAALAPVCHPATKRCVGRAGDYLAGGCDAAADSAYAGSFKAICRLGDAGSGSLKLSAYLKPDTLTASVGGAAVALAAITYDAEAGTLSFQGAKGDEVAIAYQTETKAEFDAECAGAQATYEALAAEIGQHLTCATDADCLLLPARPDAACPIASLPGSKAALASGDRQARLDAVSRRLALACTVDRSGDCPDIAHAPPRCTAGRCGG